MRFQIILNMPSHRGGASHAILVEHEAKTIEALMTIVERDGFIVVTELYRQTDGELKLKHQIGISASVVGKVKYFVDLD